jgi:16S rRNA pseudouridine516 synthase
VANKPARPLALDRLLQSQGFGSRKGCAALIKAGRVSIEGVECREPGQEFSPVGLRLEIDGEVWEYRDQAYLVLHKPANYECSHRPQHHRSVFSLLPPPLLERGVQCVGRLDADTTGLLLLTDDGSWLHALTSPKRHVPKVYRVGVRHPLTAEQCTELTAGVVLHDDPAPVAALAAEAIEPQTLRLTIAEGRYHQVKRMVAAVGNRVDTLHREAVGGFTLPADLAEGEWRWLTPDEITACRQLPGTQGDTP